MAIGGSKNVITKFEKNRGGAGEKEIPPEINCEKTDKKVILRIKQQTLEAKFKIQFIDCNIRENFERL